MPTPAPTLAVPTVPANSYPKAELIRLLGVLEEEAQNLVSLEEEMPAGSLADLNGCQRAVGFLQEKIERTLRNLP